MSEEKTTQANDTQQKQGTTGTAQAPSSNSGGDCQEYKALVAALKAKVTRLENERAGLQAKIEELSGEAKKANELQQKLAEYEALRAEREELEKQLHRKQIIMSKFPDLAPFEADGLLPDAPMEELETRLKAFKEKLDAITTAATNNANIGAVTPPNTPASGNGAASASRGLSMHDLIDKAMEAQKAGNMDEYNRLMDMILEMET